MMKVLILTEGGKDIGFGHLTRCISLYQAFDEKGITAELIVNGDGYIVDFLKDKNYEIFNWFEQKDRIFNNLNSANIVVIDSYLAARSLYDKISEALYGGWLVMIDDFNRIEYPMGIVVNPSIYGNELNYLQKDGTVYLLGKDYAILRKEFWDAPKKRINKYIKNVLLTFGGMNHSDLIYKIVSYLKSRFEFNFCIVESKKYIYDAKEMLRLILKADICISGGGQTLYELARCGMPTIGICFAENQKLNLEGWQRQGFVEYVGWHNDENLIEKIVDGIDKFRSYRERVNRSQIGRYCIDGKGPKRIVGELLKKVNYANSGRSESPK